MQNELTVCSASPNKRGLVQMGGTLGHPDVPRTPVPRWPAQPHLHGQAFLPAIQGETKHQMSDLLTLLATLNVLSCKVLQGFIFLSFPSLQLLVIIIIKHKWPLSHSTRQVLL